MDEQRKLSRSQAFTCETACTRRCRCRCGGALHGAQRVTAPDELDSLSWHDPHFPHGGHPQLPLWDDAQEVTVDAAL